MIYEYKCSLCDYREDIELGMDEDKPTRKKCPYCKKMSMHRVFGNTERIIIPKHFSENNPFNFRKKTHKKYY